MTPSNIELSGFFLSLSVFVITLLVGFKSQREFWQETSMLGGMVALFFVFLFALGGIGSN